MRYIIATLALMTAGCSGSLDDAAPDEAAKVAAGLRGPAAQRPLPIPMRPPRLLEPAGKRELVAADAKPIPQDEAKLAAQAREVVDWNLRTSIGAYEKTGKKDPRWDDLVRKVIDMAVRRDFEPDSKITSAEIHQTAKAAMDAGCDDPMVVNIFVRSGKAPTDLSDDSQLRFRRDTTGSYAASGYPAFRRAAVLESFAADLLASRPSDDVAKKEAGADLDACLALLPESAKSDERCLFWTNKWHNTIYNAINDYRKLGVPAETAYKRADAKLADLPELEETRLMLRGTFWKFYGWEARTQAFAPDVPAEGFRLFGERLAIAKKAYEEAWELDHENDFAAANLVDIDKAVGGDRDTMELWFDRAMKADGNSRMACASKLDWLDPQWHGSPEELLAFGRQCRDTRNWRAALPILCAEAHWRVSSMAGVNQNGYLASPEVWDDIRSVYQEHFQHYPADDVSRNKFALICHLGGHYREAEVQYVALGDHIAQWPDFPNVPLPQLEFARARNARIVMGEDGSIFFPGWHFVRVTNKAGQWFVATPIEAPHQTRPGILGAPATEFWQFSANGVTYEIRAVNLPPALRTESPEHILDTARALVAKERGAEPHALQATLLAARPAQEYDLDPPGLKPMQVHVETVVIGNWLYELSVTGNRDDIAGPAAREFFDSFAYQPKAGPSHQADDR